MSRGLESLYRIFEAQQRLRRWRAIHRNMMEVVRTYQDWLQAGDYVVTPKLAYKKGAESTDHLILHRGIKGEFRGWKDVFWRASCLGVSHFRSDCTGGPATALTTMPMKRKWDVVLLAPSENSVYRFAPRKSFNAEYVSIREKIRAYLPTPAYRVIQDGRALVEEFVWGVDLNQASSDSASDAVKGILNRIRLGCFLFVTEGGKRQVAQDLVSAGDAEVKAFCLARGVEYRVVVKLLGAPQIPSQNDLEPKNIILTPGGPVVIDLAATNLAWTPFWYDAMRLILTYDAYGYWRGSYDLELRNIFAACRGIGTNFNSVRRELAVAYVLIHPEKRLSDPSNIRGDLPRDVSYAVAAWKKISHNDCI
ncbi:hypothetical protein LRF89_10520 [Halorhodospira sp. 9621]|nr:hypothetical protein [Halorhodospira sp. 9621]